MALSGSYSTSFHHGKYALRIEWSATQNKDTNQSTITAKAYIDTASGWDLNFSATKYGNTTIGGQSQNWSYGSGIRTSGGTSHLINTTTKTVTHNQDGTLSLSMSTWFDINVTIYGSLGTTYYGRISASTNGTVTLDKIDRPLLNVYVSGSWRKAKNVYVYAGGAWRQAKGIWVYANGAWRPAK